MTSHVATVAFRGIDAMPVDVQVQLSAGNVVFNIVGLPDFARYLIAVEGVTDLAGNPLSGDHDRALTALKGDASGDMRVNAVDLARVRAFSADPISTSSIDQVRADITQDGRVNAIDLARVRANTDRDARGIPTPVVTASATTLAISSAVTVPAASADFGVAEAVSDDPKKESLVAPLLTPSEDLPTA